MCSNLRRSAFALVVVLTVTGCGGDGGGGTPTAPPPATQTRAIRLEAVLEFGDVAVGASGDRTLRIYNEGNSPMTVTGLTGPSPGYTATWTDGTIAPGTSQASTVRFSPTEARTYNGTVTVNANHTSGTNTTSISGRGVASLTPSPGPNGPMCAASSIPANATCINNQSPPVTAVCEDGAFSCSTTRQGTCSTHGGTKCWVCPGALCNGLTAPAPLTNPTVGRFVPIR